MPKCGAQERGRDERRTIQRQRFNTRKADWEKFIETLNRSSASRLESFPLTNKEEVEYVASTLTSVLYEACTESMPQKRRFRVSNPWWTKALTKLKRKTYGKRRTYQRELISQERRKKGGDILIKRLREPYKASKHLYSKTIKSAKRESWRNFVTSHGNKEPWGFVYKHSANKLKIERVISILRRDGNFTLNVQKTANYLLETHVPEDQIEDDTRSQREIREGARRLPEAPDAPKITDEEVKSLVRSMKNGKAAGPDLIEVEVLKTACTQITDQITRLFNSCLEVGVFPKAWKEGSLRVLLKGEDKDATDPKSYRPLCLLSVIGKLFEKHLNKRLLKTSMAPGMISDRQYGFLPGRSAEDATVELCRMVSRSEYRLITGIFFDISGAFDNVWWPKVLDNLRKRECPDNIFKVLKIGRAHV